MCAHDPRPDCGRGLFYNIREMKGIDKHKHTKLLCGLGELLELAADPLQAARVEDEIALLTENYERYIGLIAQAVQCAADYNLRHNEIRRMLCREIRCARQQAAIRASSPRATLLLHKP